VPIVYSLLRQKPPQTKIEPELREPTDPYEKFLPHHHDEHMTPISHEQNEQVAHAT
jgi:hypothetical protein